MAACRKPAMAMCCARSAYLSVAVLIGLTALAALRLRRHRASCPFSMIVLLAWCVASALWAPETDHRAAPRRSGSGGGGFAVPERGALGAERAFLIWRWLLAAMLLVNFLSIPLIAAARHGAGEIDPALVGRLARSLRPQEYRRRGLRPHRHRLFLFTRNGQRNWIGIADRAGSLRLPGHDPFQILGRLSGDRAGLRLALPLRLARRPEPRHPGALRRDPGRRRGPVCAAGCRRPSRARWKIPPSSPAARQSGRRNCAISPTIPCWARALAPSPTPRRSRRCTIMSAAAGWMRSATAITAICRCW